MRTARYASHPHAARAHRRAAAAPWNSRLTSQACPTTKKARRARPRSCAARASRRVRTAEHRHPLAFPFVAQKRAAAPRRRPPRPRDRERPARSASYGEERDAQPAAGPARVETRFTFTQARPRHAPQRRRRERNEPTDAARRPSRRAAPSTPSPRAGSPRRRGSQCRVVPRALRRQ